MTERKELIERLRWHAKSMCNGDMYREAADMLEADISRQVEVSESTRRIRKSALGTSTCRTQLRAELIERLRDATEGPRMLINEAADMLEADQHASGHTSIDRPQCGFAGAREVQPAVPQEPVAIIRCWTTPNGEGQSQLFEWCDPGIEAIADGEYKLYAAPQPQPRLTDAEIKAIEHETDMKSSLGDWNNYFARAIEAKVRGEA